MNRLPISTVEKANSIDAGMPGSRGFRLYSYKIHGNIGLQDCEVMHMKISTKGRYALRMLVDLAEHQQNGFISLNEIAKRQDISKKYLEQIIPIFNNTDVLRTSRGPQGGYMLAKSPDKYTVGEILRITEGSLAPVDCAAQDPVECARGAECVMLPVWQGLNKVINDYLDSITLQDILDREQERYANDYII